MLLGGLPPIAEIISRLLVVLIAMDVHEFAHAYIAYRMGDTTARDMGKMTLNPLANINWIGFAMFVFVGFGILGSAPVSERRMRNPRWGMLAAVGAGPLSNLLLAAICAIPFWLNLVQPTFYQELIPRTVGYNLPSFGLFLTDMIYFNVLLFLFNLIPLLPLDGWTIVSKLLPYDLSRQWERYKQYTTYIFFGLLLLSFVSTRFNVFSIVILPPLNFLMQLFLHLPYAPFG